MNNTNNSITIIDLVIVIMFFCGVALIAVGLWQMWPPVALVFLGIACIYVAACVGKLQTPRERTDKK